MSEFMDQQKVEEESEKEVTNPGKKEESEGEVDNEEDEEEEEGEGGEKISSALSADIAFVKTSVVKAAVVTVSRDYITVVIMRTQYSRLQLRVQYPASYPGDPPIVEITSASLPAPLLRNKAKECIELAKQHLGAPQFHLIYDHIYNFVQSNLFLSCWKEVKQVAALCEGHGQMGLKENEGILQFRLKGQEGYFQNFNLKVPYLYPEEPLEIEFLKSQFPEDMQRMCYAQAEAMVARCVAGIPPDHHYQAELSASSPPSSGSATLKGKIGKEQPKVRLTTDSLKNLKHDMNVIKQMSDLRAVDKGKDKRQQFSPHSSQARRDARKDLRRLAQTEATLDKAEQEKQADMEQSEMISLMGLKLSDTAIPSLLPVCQYLIQEYVVRLSTEQCQACNTPVLPSQATLTAAAAAAAAAGGAKKKRGAKNMKHIRANCGHWLHYHCLNTMLTTPPFLHHCANCQRKVGHPDWSEDVQQLERAWQMEQAMKRELTDVSDFMDVGSEFAV